MERISFVSLALILTILLHNCASTDIEESQHVNQSRIYQNHRISISEDNNKAQAYSVFRFGGPTGTTLKLSKKSKVTLNGKKLKGGEQVFSGYVYNLAQMKLSDDYNYTFEFTDTVGTSYSNSISLAPISLKDAPEKMENTGEYIIKWEGSPVGSDEQVNLHLQYGQDNFQTKKWTQRIIGAHEIRINTSDIVDPINGAATFKIERVIDKELENAADVGGVISGIYESRKVPTQLNFVPDTTVTQ